MLSDGRFPSCAVQQNHNASEKRSLSGPTIAGFKFDGLKVAVFGESDLTGL